MDKWFEDMFVNEAKKSLTRVSNITDKEVSKVVTDYLITNPIGSAVATIENDIVKVR